MNRQRFLLPALLVLTVARLLMLPLHSLSAVELHALECSQQGDLWHPSLGPVLPFLIKISTWVFGANPFGVRFFAPLLMLGASWLLWELARGMFDVTTASWTLVIFHVTPAVNVASVTMTLTTLGIISSIGVLSALRYALHREHPMHFHWWLLGGVLVAVFLAEWRLIMLAASAIASMALTQRGRRALMKWPVLPVLSSCLGLVVTLFFAWNSEHGWASLSPIPGAPMVTVGHLALHLIVAVSPLLLVAYGWALVESVLRRPMDYAVAFLYAFTWPLVTLDILAWSALPWPLCGFGTWLAPAAMLLAHHVLSYEPAPPRLKMWLRSAVLATAAVQSCWMMHRGLDKITGFFW